MQITTCRSKQEVNAIISLSIDIEHEVERVRKVEEEVSCSYRVPLVFELALLQCV
jgi:hypothetical protein